MNSSSYPIRHMRRVFVETGYLPRESTNTSLNQGVLRDLWPADVIVKKALRKAGIKNESQAREWFRQRPHLHCYFEEMNNEVVALFETLQKRAVNGLLQEIEREKFSYMDYQYAELQKSLNFQKSYGANWTIDDEPNKSQPEKPLLFDDLRVKREHTKENSDDTDMSGNTPVNKWARSH